MRTKGARSPRTCSRRLDAKSAGTGGAGPELRCLMIAAMLGPHVPLRTAAWESERSPSRAGPAVWTRTAPKRRRRQ
eukprot:596414-Alexandrium_andersonii.AAC.1